MTTTTSSKTIPSLSAFARLVALSALMAFTCAPSFAEKPEWAGKGNPHSKNKEDKRGSVESSRDSRDHNGSKRSNVVDVRVGGFFGEPQRTAANTYYGQQFKGGHCPPGLAKKNNGCMPPGQARKYAIGQPLPRGVVYYPVPQPVMVQLGTPPAGHKYVRIATDILLIAIGTGLVVDAMQDLGRI